MVTVALHEFGHALAGWCTCASGVKIHIDEDEGGATEMVGGISCITLPAGYLGSSLLGALMVFAGFNVLASKIVSVILGVILLIVLICASTWLTRILTLAFVGMIVGLWFTPNGIGLKYFVLFMGVMSCLYSLWDILEDLVIRRVPGSDAYKLGQQCKMPPQLCGVLWFLVSIIFLAAAIISGIIAFKNDPAVENN